VSAIVVEHLVKSFGKERVVDDVSFSVEPGELVALLGPSGGGKSTVLRMIAGLETPDSGAVRIGAADVTGKKVQDRHVGFVFQHYALFRHMSVRQNIAFGMEVRKVAKAEAQRRVDEMLHLVQLADLGDRFPHQLSGGQRQRVALARALAPQPRLMLLDEPFGALDAKVRLELRTWLRRLTKEREMTTVFVTHDQEEAMDLASRVAVIHKGKIEQIGSPSDLHDTPETPFVASFIGSSNVLQGKVTDGRVVVGGCALPYARGLPEGEAVTVFARPFDVLVSEDRSLGRGTVERVSRYGGKLRAELSLLGGIELVAEGIDIDAPKDLEAGREVGVRIRAASMFVAGDGKPSLIRAGGPVETEMWP
jgi:sulfate transport system ATP-binding protein